jgi:S-layer homology domain
MPSAALRLGVFAAALVLALAGCSKGSQSTTTTTESTATTAPLAEASANAAASPSESPAASPPAASTEAASASPAAATAAASASPIAAAVAPSATPTAAALAKIAFTDISGVEGAEAIRQLAFLGALDSTSGQFRPHDPITRAEYVRWLVKANNAYFANRPEKRIRLAETSQPSFVDVASSDPDFKYVQGMSDAGYVIGVDKNHFAPNRNLTREELVAILISRDNEGSAMPNAGPPSTWNYAAGGGTISVQLTDRDKVSKPYWGAFQVNNGWGNSYAMDVLHRVYGTIKVFHPQQLATRADAAIALQEIDHANAGNLVPKN